MFSDYQQEPRSLLSILISTDAPFLPTDENENEIDLPFAEEQSHIDIPLESILTTVLDILNADHQEGELAETPRSIAKSSEKIPNTKGSNAESPQLSTTPKKAEAKQALGA